MAGGLSASATCDRRERWVTPEGRTTLAPLLRGVAGHFGPEQRRFVPIQYHQGQSAMSRLLAFYRRACCARNSRPTILSLSRHLSSDWSAGNGKAGVCGMSGDRTL